MTEHLGHEKNQAEADRESTNVRNGTRGKTVVSDAAGEVAATAAEMPKTTWIRQAIEMALAVQAEDDQPISRAEALRALTLLRSVRHVA